MSMNNRSKNNRSVNSRIADFRSYDVAARRAEIVRQTDLTEADIAVYDAADGLTIVSRRRTGWATTSRNATFCPDTTRR